MKILVVEDDRKIANLVNRILRSEGFKVDVSHDGEQAFQMIMDDEYGLILLDIMLRKKDGITLLKEIRREDILTPVLVVSGMTRDEEITEAMDAGANDYLKKPFLVSELIAKIKSIQRRENGDQMGKTSYSDLYLDPVRLRVW